MPETFWARTDSNSANNPALNLTGAAPTQITFVRSGPTGDLKLEYNGGAADPDTKVSINGVEYNFAFQLSAVLPTQKNQGAGKVPDQFQGDPIYIIRVLGYPSAGSSTRLAFMPQEQATRAEMASFGNGAIRLQQVDTTTNGAVCFAAGTLIATPDGDLPVEALVPGDLVLTADHGPRPVRWIARSTHRWPGSDAADLPVLIRRGAMGGGLPVRDLVISPQHKVLIDDRLAPAKGLVGRPGIRQMAGRRAVTYVHVLLDRHELLIAEGLASESFYPGPVALAALAPSQREGLFRACPEAALSRYGPMVRPALSVREAEALADPGPSRQAA